MRRLFFTPVGTSCLNRIPNELKLASFDEKFNWVTNRLMMGYRQDLKMIMTYSAEIKSLLKRDINHDDMIQFFCTDTEEGKLSGEILQNFFRSEIGCEVLLTIIPGLQALDAAKFRNVGVKSYIEELLASYNKYQYAYNIVMNITGGLKNVIPYCTIASMLLSIPIYYILEHSEEIMELLIIPITLDFLLFEKYHRIFLDLVEQGAMPESEFFKTVSYEDREPLKLLVEKNQKYYTFIALGLLLWVQYIEQFL